MFHCYISYPFCRVCDEEKVRVCFLFSFYISLIFPRTGPLGSHRCQTLDASFRQSAPCNINNCMVGNPRTWSVIFTVDSHMFLVFFIYPNHSNWSWTQERDVSSLSNPSRHNFFIATTLCVSRTSLNHLVMSMMSDQFALHTARKETRLERIGYVALDCPIVWSLA